METTSPFKYTLKDDIFSSITHGIGFGLSIAALCILVVFAATQESTIKVVSFSIYGSSLIILYLSSTLYHGIRVQKVRKFFNICDHISIFLLIAGTYTPLSLVTIKGAWGWSMFGVTWGLALVGIVLKVFFTGRFRLLSTLIYIGMGWIIVIALKPLINSLDPVGVALITAGGVSYTGGTIFYMRKSLPFAHSIWHLFVLGGSIIHFYAIYFYVLP